MTEGERARMSAQLASSVPSEDVNDLITTLDNECENGLRSSVNHTTRGPFAVFSIAPYRETSQSGHTTDVCQGHDDLHSTLAHDFVPWGEDIHAGDDPLNPSLLPELLDLPDMPNATNRIEEIFDADSLGLGPNIVTPQISLSEDIYPIFAPPQTSAAEDMQIPLICAQPQPGIDLGLPDDTIFLLKHYTTTIVNALTLFRHTKTPWHTLFLPHAKACLAALSLGEEVDHATLCTFYGMQAVSACSLSHLTQSKQLHDRAEHIKLQAREQARLMLKSAYAVPKTAKYKHILMALLIMVQINTFAGNRDGTECYLLEAEKFVRLKGLNRVKSRKVRMLHHCLVYTRIFYESLCVFDFATRHRRHVRQAVECNGLRAHGQDSLSFRLMEWRDLHQEMLVPKGRDAGENDLHLEQPGLYTATLYPEIYGVPEPLVFLVSQVIRLANEVDASDRDMTGRFGYLRGIMRRAKSIEMCIENLQQLVPSTESLSSHVEQQLLDEVLFGMQSALKIYFQRRIYDVPASRVQSLVLNVRDWLLRRDLTLCSLGTGYVGFIWPAFIAACEAEDLDARASFSYWFRSSTLKSGLSYFTDVLRIVEEVWQRKQDPGQANASWLDVMREKDVEILGPECC